MAQESPEWWDCYCMNQAQTKPKNYLCYLTQLGCVQTSNSSCGTEQTFT
jgi:hypothetical protein